LNKRRLLLLPLLLIVLLSAAACGGGGSNDSDAEGEIETVIETSATSTDPASCGEYSTLKFMEQTAGGEGKEAENACEESVEEGDNPESVSVTNIKVDSEDATADAEFVGGSFSGQTLSVALIEEEGGWKLNEFTGFVNFDAAALTEALVERLEGEEGIEPKTISCIAEGLEGLDEGEYEELVIEDNTKPFEEIAEGCE
jgi:hypothetical protein